MSTVLVDRFNLNCHFEEPTLIDYDATRNLYFLNHEISHPAKKAGFEVTTEN